LIQLPITNTSLWKNKQYFTPILNCWMTSLKSN
jgi:hypothetical protein